MKARRGNAILIVLTALVAFVTAAVALHPGPFPGDVELANSLQEILGRDKDAAWLAGFATILGVLPWLAVAVAAAAGLIGGWRGAVLATLGAACSWFLIEPGFKHMTERPRPTADLVAVLDIKPGFGFPSGGALHATVLVGILLYLLRQRLKAPFRSPAFAIGGLAALIVGLARIASGAHWASDVVGAWLLAVWTILLVSRLDPWLKRIGSSSV